MTWIFPAAGLWHPVAALGSQSFPFLAWNIWAPKAAASLQLLVQTHLRTHAQTQTRTVIWFSHTVHARAGLGHHSPLPPASIAPTHAHMHTHIVPHTGKLFSKKTGQIALAGHGYTSIHLSTCSYMTYSFYLLSPLSSCHCSSPNDLEPSLSPPAYIAYVPALYIP